MPGGLAIVRKNLDPGRIVVLGFLFLILAGTLLLRFPFSTAAGKYISIVDSLFTSTSAVCVTGLAINDIGTFFSPAGQVIIACLIQIGGLGVMTVSTVFAIFLGKKLTLKENIVIQGEMNQHRLDNLPVLVKYIALLTFGIESIGALALFLRWLALENWPVNATFANACFHSVAAFCNAGFSLFPDNLCKYAADPVINLTIMLLIFFGGIGFMVIMEMAKFFTGKKKKERVSVQTRLVLQVSLWLILAGAIFIFVMEKDNTLKALSLGGKIWASFFQSVTPRTAGFNTVPIGSMLSPTLFFIVFLMFIGASPGSTGGGIKTTTFGVLFAFLHSMLAGKDRITIFKRTISKENIRKAMIVFFLALGWVFIATMALMMTEKQLVSQCGDNFMRILFETVSAFGTVGLSTGITPGLTDAGKLILTLTMFIGRVGALTIILSLAYRHENIIFTYPEEKIMIG